MCCVCLPSVCLCVYYVFIMCCAYSFFTFNTTNTTEALLRLVKLRTILVNVAFTEVNDIIANMMPAELKPAAAYVVTACTAIHTVMAGCFDQLVSLDISKPLDVAWVSLWSHIYTSSVNAALGAPPVDGAANKSTAEWARFETTLGIKYGRMTIVDLQKEFTRVKTALNDTTTELPPHAKKPDYCKLCCSLRLQEERAAEAARATDMQFLYCALATSLTSLQPQRAEEEAPEEDTSYNLVCFIFIF